MTLIRSWIQRASFVSSFPDLMQVEGGRLIGDSMVPERTPRIASPFFADGLRRVWRDMSVIFDLATYLLDVMLAIRGER